MRFYTASHQRWCGIDLHARTMYVCILDAQGQILLHKSLRATFEAFSVQDLHRQNEAKTECEVESDARRQEASRPPPRSEESAPALDRGGS